MSFCAWKESCRVFVLGIVVMLTACESREPLTHSSSGGTGATPGSGSSNSQPGTNTSDRYKVFSTNRRGMSFPDQDFSVFAISPPANFVHAQVVRTARTRDQLPELVDNASVELRYNATPDFAGW